MGRSPLFREILEKGRLADKFSLSYEQAKNTLNRLAYDEYIIKHTRNEVVNGMEYGKGMYFRLLVSGKLATYLAEIDRDAQSMFETIVNQSKESNGVTEQLKAENPMEWVRLMNAIVNMAEEFVLAEIVYK